MYACCNRAAGLKLTRSLYMLTWKPITLARFSFLSAFIEICIFILQSKILRADMLVNDYQSILGDKMQQDLMCRNPTAYETYNVFVSCGTA